MAFLCFRSKVKLLVKCVIYVFANRSLTAQKERFESKHDFVLAAPNIAGRHVSVMLSLNII